jgi:hypothetical protein
MTSRVCLTVSSLLPTDTFFSTATHCRCFQPAYFPVLHHFSECICVTWQLTDSRARVRESVYINCTSMEIQYVTQYFMYTFSHVDMCLDFFIYCEFILALLRMNIPAFACPCLLMCARLTHCFAGKAPAHTCHACARTDAHAKAL